MAHGQSEGRRIDRAVSVLCVVGIGFFSADSTSIVDVLEGVRGQASTAAVALEIACTIDELLLRVGLETTVLDKVGALQAADG